MVLPSKLSAITGLFTNLRPPLMTSYLPNLLRSMSNIQNSNPDVSNFPPSTTTPSTFFTFPGITAESTGTTRRLMEENDRKYDIFQKNRIFHNHFSHSLLTRYALGAPPKLLEDTWKNDEPDNFPLDLGAKGRKKGDISKFPKSITRDNWDDPATLGVTDAYPLYLVFFNGEIDRIGLVETFRQYVVAPTGNFESTQGHAAPQMLHRFLSGVLHPIIHVGFGVEFNERLMVAEGIAQAASNSLGYSQVFTPEFLKGLQEDSAPESPKPLLQIYADLCADKTFNPGKLDPEALIGKRITDALKDGNDEKLRKIVQSWSLSNAELGDGQDGWRKKVQEVDLLATLIACGTTRRGYEKRVDFFLMHGLTSSLFTHAFMPVLSEAERRVFLASYLLVLLTVSISRGRPKLDVGWLMEATPFPVGPGTEGKAGGDVIADPTDKTTRNPWNSVVESSLYDYDAHVPKSIRSLLHYANLHGPVPKGGFVGSIDPSTKNEVIPGMSQVDGSVFVRAAGVIMEVAGWCREGDRSGGWDRSNLGYDEAWDGAKRKEHA